MSTVWNWLLRSNPWQIAQFRNPWYNENNFSNGGTLNKKFLFTNDDKVHINKRKVFFLTFGLLDSTPTIFLYPFSSRWKILLQKNGPCTFFQKALSVCKPTFFLGKMGPSPKSVFIVFRHWRLLENKKSLGRPNPKAASFIIMICCFSHHIQGLQYVYGKGVIFGGIQKFRYKKNPNRKKPQLK